MTPWTATCQAPLSSTLSQTLHKFTSNDSMMLSNDLILCCPLLPLPSIFPSIRVFSNESALYIRWPKYWSFSFSISPFNGCETCSVVSNSLQSHELYSPWNLPGQNTRVGSLSLLQGIFPAQGLNPGLLHCRFTADLQRILYQLSHKRSPRILE